MMQFLVFVVFLAMACMFLSWLHSRLFEMPENNAAAAFLNLFTAVLTMFIGIPILYFGLLAFFMSNDCGQFICVIVRTQG